LLGARLLLLSSMVAVIAGIAPLLYLAGLVAWQVHVRLDTGAWIALPAALAFADRALLYGGELTPILAFIPHLTQLTHIDWSWTTNELVAQILRHAHIGAVPGVIGCAIMATGISGVRRQAVLIRIHKQRRKEPLRALDERLAEASGTDAGLDLRREPVIGSVDFAPSPANDTPTPQATMQKPESIARDTPNRQPRACRLTRGRPARRRAAA